ncbi:MAG: hypothetical protein AAGD01_08310 [Acidobacteriota bacterium]
MKLHHLLFALLLAMAAWTATPAELAAQGTQTLVEKVRFCTGGPLICFGHTQSEYQAWENNNVGGEKQKETFISRYVEPPRASVEHLVYLSAGQQFRQGDFNLITGQPNDFKAGFDRRDEEHWRTVDQRSLAFRLFSEGHRDPINTFAGLAFDARFNLDFTLNNKDEIADAHYEWLQTKFFASNLKSVYLAGHSRGGALMLHLAERFRRDFPDVPLIVHLFDPVLNSRQGELGVLGARLINPLNPNFRPYEFDYFGHFPNRNRLLVYNFVSGETIDPFLDIPVAWSAAQRTGFGAQAPVFNNGWFFQQYFNQGHDAIARSVARIDDALEDLELFAEPMIQDYCDSQPPIARCNVSPIFSYGDFATVTFDALGSTSQSGAPLTSYSWSFSGSSQQVGTPPSGTGIGPQNVTIWRVGSNSNLVGTVTVTDGNGNSASASCTAHIQEAIDCDGFGFCLEPEL